MTIISSCPSGYCARPCVALYTVKSSPSPRPNNPLQAKPKVTSKSAPTGPMKMKNDRLILKVNLINNLSTMDTDKGAMAMTTKSFVKDLSVSKQKNGIKNTYTCIFLIHAVNAL